jgi:hypothetical protein
MAVKGYRTRFLKAIESTASHDKLKFIEHSVDAFLAARTISEARGVNASLKRRARLLISDITHKRQFNIRTNSIVDPICTRDKDPYLAQVVRRVEAGEITIDYLYLASES